MAQRRKVLALGAHDDDVILGICGTLLERHQGDDIFVQVATNGENSHKVVLGVTEHPSPLEVAIARRGEFERACALLRKAGLSLHFEQWSYPDTCGALTKARQDVEAKLRALMERFAPDIIYFQAKDAHEDHRAMHDATLEVLRRTAYRGIAYTYAIWTQELAAGRPEVDASQIVERADVKVVDVRRHMFQKEHALRSFESQLDTHPSYPGWAAQKAPILDAAFVEHFLRGEERITRVW